jgi:hypothetical protein
MKATIAAIGAVLLFAAPAAAQTPDITGKWDVTFNTTQGPMPAALTIAKAGDALSGRMTSAQGEVPVTIAQKDKTVSLSLSVQTQNGPLPVSLQGTVDGDAMKGTVDFGGRGSAEWTAKRTAPAAAQSPSQEKPAPTMTGTWLFEVTHSAGVSTPTVTITQTGEKLSGKYAGSYGESELTGSIKGSDFTFTVEIGTEQKVKVVYTGSFAENSVKGNVTLGELGEGTFTGKRK